MDTVDPNCIPEWHPLHADKAAYAGEIRRGVSSLEKPRPPRIRKPSLDAETAVRGIRSGNPAILARAITMVESEAAAHKAVAREIVRRCLPFAGDSIRVGITGVPGAGKSTFIESLGSKLCASGHRVAVLAVDPTSALNGGSILGDKTRMESLSRLPGAFIRPSPSGGALGGVAAKTREAMLLCEAAGYDVVLVETVGVGQSEVAVRSMVDFFLLLQIAGAGDELQGIKKGVIEMADAIVVNKADGDNLAKANAARADYQRVVHYLQPYTPGWMPKAMTCSAASGAGIEAIWEMVLSFVAELKARDLFESRRAEQRAHWFKSMLEESVWRRFHAPRETKEKLAELRGRVERGEISVLEAVESVVGPS